MKIGSPEWEKVIRESVSPDIRVDDEMACRFTEYASELLRWNRKTNLTSITHPPDIAIKHFADSVFPAAFIDRHGSLLDIGSGGGFPGIPLKIVIPTLSVTLIDASRKKVSFLGQIIRQLSLTDIKAVHARAEELAQKDAYPESFDTVISRALSDLETYLALALPLVSKTGTIIAMKGKLPHSEIESVRSFFHKICDGKDCAMEERHYTLPFDKGQRTILSFHLNG